MVGSASPTLEILLFPQVELSLLTSFSCFVFPERKDAEVRWFFKIKQDTMQSVSKEEKKESDVNPSRVGSN